MSFKIKKLKENEQAKDFVIDVCDQFSYQNQSQEYMDVYKKWRKNDKNPFGYNYINDSRVITYKDGAGFVNDKPERVEKLVLKKCATVLGFSLFFVVAITISLMLIFDIQVFEKMKQSYFEVNKCINYSLKEAVELGLFNAFKYLIPLIMFNIFARVPYKIMLPIQVSNRPLFFASVPIFWGLISIARLANSGLYELTSKFNISLKNTDFLYSSDIKAMLIYGIVQIVLVSIISEILIHGAIMQTFRQFGDVFAILLSACIYALMNTDLTSMINNFLIALVIGYFVLRTGSLLTGILLKMMYSTLMFASHMVFIYIELETALIINMLVSIFTIAVGLCVFLIFKFKLKFNFMLCHNRTYLSLLEKFYTVFLSPSMLLWAVPSVLISLLTIRFIR